MRTPRRQAHSTQIEITSWVRAAVVGVLLIALGGCGGLGPTATPSINEKIAWTGKVFQERDAAVVADILSQDGARQLVADYDPELEIVALHAGELSPNVSGPSYLGYVVEALRPGDSEPKIVLINAEEREVGAGPGVLPDGNDQ